MQQQNKFVLFLNAIGRALVGDLRGPAPKRLTTLDVHYYNGVMHLGDYELSEADAYDVAVEILRRLPK